MWICGKVRLDRDDERYLIFRERLCGFLIFSPEPRMNRFFNILQRFPFIFALRYAARQCGALGNDPSIFARRQCDVKHHWRSASARFSLEPSL